MVFVPIIITIAEYVLLTLILYMAGWLIEQVLKKTIVQVIERVISKKSKTKQNTQNKLYNILNGPQNSNNKFSLIESMVAYLCFSILWFLNLPLLYSEGIFQDMDIYGLFVVFGLFAIIWCNSSWDPEDSKKSWRIADKMVRGRKQLVMYSLLAIFLLVLGYEQMRVTFIPEYELKPLFSLFNLATVTAITALDRVINQAFRIMEMEEETEIEDTSKNKKLKK